MLTSEDLCEDSTCLESDDPQPIGHISTYRAIPPMVPSLYKALRCTEFLEGMIHCEHSPHRKWQMKLEGKTPFPAGTSPNKTKLRDITQR